MAYGGSRIAVVGRITLRVRRGKAKYLIDYKLVKGNQIRPLLGRVGTNIVSYLDNDAMNKPDTGEAHVYAVSSSKQPVTEDDLIRQYPQVFSDGVGCLEGEYHIRVDPQQR